MNNARETGSARRAALRVAAFFVGYFLILLATSVPKGMAPRRGADFVWGGLSSLAVYSATLFVLAKEQRSRRELGLAPDRHSAVRLLFGALIGVAVSALSIGLISLLLGPIRLVPSTSPDVATWLAVIASFLVLSCMEELGFRAYPLRTLIPVFGVWPAQLMVAVLFGLSHLVFGWSWQSVVMGVIPSGLLFGIMAVRSNGLAMPIGLHAALNIVYWMIGAKDTPGVWTVSVDPEHTARLTTFAPLVGTVVTLLASLVVARWPWRRQAQSETTG